MPMGCLRHLNHQSNRLFAPLPFHYYTSVLRLEMNLIPAIVCLLHLLYLSTVVVSSSTIEKNNNNNNNMFDMDVFELENGQYEIIVPSSRRKLKAPPEPNCEPVSECDICTSGQREKEPLCKDTGRVQRFKCKPEDGEVVEIFKTCKRTIADDEFLMMQMQVFCFFLGSLALLSVRKNRTVSTSLFDQRKAARRGSQYPRSDEVEIEFTPMMGQDNTNEELQPLRPIDVV